MSPEDTAQLVLVLLGAALAFGAMGWARYGSTIGPPLSVAALASAAVTERLISTR